MNLFNPSPRVTRNLAHGERLTLDGHTIRLRVDGRATRVSLRIDQSKREVVATAPTPRRLSEAVSFAQQRAGWIASQMARLPEPSALEPGAVIIVAGEPCRLETGTGRARRIERAGEEPMRFVAPSDDRFAPSILRLLKAEALSRLTGLTAIHASALNQPMPVISLGDPKGRWGSCRPAPRGGPTAQVEVGRIRYSWRLILAPAEVMDYVVAHECAHLIEANHGPRFWALVHDLAGDHTPHRKWLRANGGRLQAFGEA